MINKVTKTAAIAALAGVAIFGLSACAADTKSDTSSPSASSSAVTPNSSDEASPSSTPIGGNIVAPVVVDITSLNGTTQNIIAGQVLDINVTDEDPSVWSGVSSDPTVASVTEGSKTDMVTTNPGVNGVKAGNATVTFTNSFTKEVVTFTVVVAA